MTGRIRELREEQVRLRKQLDEVSAEIRRLELREIREEHPCRCVSLNRDIGVRTMLDAHNCKRMTFGTGAVADLLSAHLDCPLCRGTGVPANKEAV